MRSTLSMTTRWLSAILIVSLACMTLPAAAADVTASLAGAIVRSTDQTPLPGARLHAGDLQTGRVFSSSAADDDGSFALGDLHPSTYRLAVESDGGLYVVGTPVALAPGTARTLNLAVGSYAADESDGDDDWSFRENPLTAALAASGIAVVLGLVIGGSSDSRTSSPTQP